MNYNFTFIKKGIKIFCLFFILVTIIISATTKATFAQENRKKIGLILSGGGGRGAAHVGVLKTLEKENIKIDYIVGTSVGALIGGLYASGVPINDIEDFIANGNFNQYYKTSFTPFRMVFYPFSKLTSKLKGKEFFPGIYSGEDFKNFLDTEIPKRGYQHRDIAFRAVTVDLAAGEIVELDLNEGIGKTIQASIAVPGLRKPVLIGDKLITDGGTLNLIPVRSKEDLNVDVIIVIDATPQIDQKNLKEFNSFENIITRTINIALGTQKKASLSKADLVITPNLNGMEMLDLDKKKLTEAIAEGEKSTQEAIPRLKEIIMY